MENPELVLNRGEHLGFEWIVTHNSMGYRCGYVRVPAGHPWHGKHYDDVRADVHGGLTFSEPDMACGKGGPDDAHWFGFDCAHAFDLVDPELRADNRAGHAMAMFLNSVLERGADLESHIWTQEEVESECRRLCGQAEASYRIAKGI